MLQSLFLRDFVIVDRADIEFADGFCALSGETGAGKSILLDALGLALGARADSNAVREGARRTEITATFEPDETVRNWLDLHELANEDEAELLMRRVIDAHGRSKSFINGTPVKLAQLREVSEQLLEIHGQHASQSLLRTEGQRGLLDNYAGLAAPLSALHACWREWQSARNTLAEATGHSAEMAAERERLIWQRDEIVALNLQAGEWTALSHEQQRLANASSLISAAQSTVQRLSEGEQAMHDQLARMITELQSGARLDDKLAGPLEMLETARIQLAEAGSDLGAYVDSVEADPGRLEAVEQRVSAIFGLARKLGLDPDELPARATQLNERLTEIERAQDLDKLQVEVDRLRVRYDTQASEISTARRRAAGKLAGEVAGQLSDLGMGAAHFDILLTAADPGPHGADQITFQFAGHGSALRPLARVASGGELSRVSLAIAVSAAQSNPVRTLIFDEADAGVGGSVADAIGLMMRHLGQSRQVMAVTHLPQVAARAHHHFQVSKKNANGLVTSRVVALDATQRVEEIARMLGGAKVTATTRLHATELLALAASDKPAPRAKPAKKKAGTTRKRGTASA